MATIGYCEEEDLLIGRLQGRLPPTIAPTDFITNAAREIDAKLGVIYVVPFVMAGAGALPPHQATLIKNINAKLASGQLILAATISQELNTVHQYGLWLVRQAEMELMAVANGDVLLNWQRVDSNGNPIDNTNVDPPEVSDPMAFIPGASNRDARSGVQVFEENFMTDTWPCIYPPDPWSPGA